MEIFLRVRREDSQMLRRMFKFAEGFEKVELSTVPNAKEYLKVGIEGSVTMNDSEKKKMRIARDGIAVARGSVITSDL